MAVNIVTINQRINQLIQSFQSILVRPLIYVLLCDTLYSRFPKQIPTTNQQQEHVRAQVGMPLTLHLPYVSLALLHLTPLLLTNESVVYSRFHSFLYPPNSNF